MKKNLVSIIIPYHRKKKFFQQTIKSIQKQTYNKFELIIIYDDIDLDYGMIRYRAEGSAGTHNGLKSIIQELGSSNIARLRVGIGPVATPYSLKDFVLQSFTKDEWCSVSSITAACVNFFDTFFVNGDRDAMNQFNNKSFL